MKRKRIALIFSFVCLSIFGTLFAKEISVGYQELGKWTFWGKGFVVADSNREQVILSELPGSKGVMFALSAYLFWGLHPIYWRLLDKVTSTEIVSHRIL
ncbi:MAG: hypothetical protein V2J62_09700 [candidate division KSB1 bacterium]|jgi:hypothetical protein|nr:hypothetical protein [candidate division KSB1 bacterium]